MSKHIILTADLSELEARVLAYLSDNSKVELVDVERAQQAVSLLGVTASQAAESMRKLGACLRETKSVQQLDKKVKSPVKPYFRRSRW